MHTYIFLYITSSAFNLLPFEKITVTTPVGAEYHGMEFQKKVKKTEGTDSCWGKNNVYLKKKNYYEKINISQRINK